MKPQLPVIFCLIITVAAEEPLLPNVPTELPGPSFTRSVDFADDKTPACFDELPDCKDRAIKGHCFGMVHFANGSELQDVQLAQE